MIMAWHLSLNSIDEACKTDEFYCQGGYPGCNKKSKNGRECYHNCIPKIWLRDGEEDCGDGSDETCKFTFICWFYSLGIYLLDFLNNWTRHSNCAFLIDKGAFTYDIKSLGR